MRAVLALATLTLASARLHAPQELEYKYSPLLVAEIHRSLYADCGAGNYYDGTNSTTVNETATGGCVACPADTYQNDDFECFNTDCDYYGVDACMDCPHGSSSDEGSSACVCEDGALWEFSHDEGGCMSLCDDGTYPVDRDDDGVDDFCAPEYLYFDDYPAAWIEGVDAEVSLSFSGWDDEFNVDDVAVLFAMADGDDCHVVPDIDCDGDCDSCSFGPALTQVGIDNLADWRSTITIEDHTAGTDQCLYAFVCEDPELYAATGTFTVFNELDEDAADDCPGLIFDANLECCEDDAGVDSCGICGGSNACAVAAEVFFDFADSSVAEELLDEEDTSALEDFEDAFVAALIDGLGENDITCDADDITIIQVCVTVLATDVTTCVAGSDMRRSLRNLLQEDGDAGSVVTVEFQVASSVEAAGGGAVDMAEVATSINEQASNQESAFTESIADSGLGAEVNTNLGAQTAFTGEAGNGLCEIGETPEDEPACTTTVVVDDDGDTDDGGISGDSTSEDGGGGGGIGGGAIAGIVIGCLAGVGIAGLAYTKMSGKDGLSDYEGGRGTEMPNRGTR